MDSYKLTIEAFDKAASAYQDKFMDIDLYNDTYDLFCQMINRPNATIFEIGCGPGNITRYILSKRPDFNVEGIDVSPNMVQLARKNNTTAVFDVMDCREIDNITKKYDGIICGFCMPYLSKEDCTKLVKDSSQLLNNEGVIYLSTIEGEYEKSGFETSSNGQSKAYVYYHQEDYLKQLLEENNFEIVSLVKKHYAKTQSEISTHLIFIAKKN